VIWNPDGRHERKLFFRLSVGVEIDSIPASPAPPTVPSAVVSGWSSARPSDPRRIRSACDSWRPWGCRPWLKSVRYPSNQPHPRRPRPPEPTGRPWTRIRPSGGFLASPCDSWRPPGNSVAPVRPAVAGASLASVVHGGHRSPARSRRPQYRRQDSCYNRCSNRPGSPPPAVSGPSLRRPRLDG
jgi:hypothetical protein